MGTATQRHHHSNIAPSTQEPCSISTAPQLPKHNNPAASTQHPSSAPNPPKPSFFYTATQVPQHQALDGHGRANTQLGTTFHDVHEVCVVLPAMFLSITQPTWRGGGGGGGGVGYLGVGEAYVVVAGQVGSCI